MELAGDVALGVVVGHHDDLAGLGPRLPYPEGPRADPDHLGKLSWKRKKRYVADLCAKKRVYGLPLTIRTIYDNP